jgi:hypothetical protein
MNNPKSTQAEHDETQEAFGLLQPFERDGVKLENELRAEWLREDVPRRTES